MFEGVRRRNVSRSGRYAISTWLLAVCCLAASLSAGEAATVRHAFRIETWSGGAYTDKQTRAFQRCTATTPGANGSSISYSVNGQFRWSLRLSNPAWSFIPGATQHMGIQIGDARGAARATAIAIEKTVLELQTDDQILLFAKLRIAQKLRLIMGGLGLEFSLFGGGKVLSALTQCVLRSTNYHRKLKSLNSTFENREPSTAPVTQKEAAALASRIIEYARVPDSKILPSQQGFVLPTDAAWRIDLVTAGVTVTEAPLSKEQLAEAVVAKVLRACRGGFFFLSLPDAINNSPVMRVFTSCQTDEATTSSHYLIVPRPKAGHYIFAVVGAGSSFIGIAHRAADEYEARLRAVVALAINKIE